MKNAKIAAYHMQKNYKIIISEPTNPLNLDGCYGNDFDTGIECCNLSVSSISEHYTQEDDDSELDELKINFPETTSPVKFMTRQNHIKISR